MILSARAWLAVTVARTVLPLVVKPERRSLLGAEEFTEPAVDTPPREQQSTNLLGTGEKGSGARKHISRASRGTVSGKKLGRVKPLLRIPGNASRWGHPINLVEDLGFHKQLGGSFSLMCTLTMARVNPWQRIFDFSFKADVDSITAGAFGNSSHLHFTIFKGKKKKTVKVWNFFEPGKSITALFSVSHSGRMRVWKNGDLVGEIEGHAPYFNERPHLMIGGHYKYKEQFFRGVIGNVKIWSKEVMPPHPSANPVSFAKNTSSLAKRAPKRQAKPGPPTPAPHAWSRILMSDEPRFMLTTTTTRATVLWELAEGQIAGPPLPKPPPKHWD
jgi:hypothetical protein